MIKDIEVENFRCFEQIKVEGFERINLIGGKNNSGKTALLEAIFIYKSSDPRGIVKLRGLRDETEDFLKKIPERAWENFFLNQDTERTINIKGKEVEYGENIEISIKISQRFEDRMVNLNSKKSVLQITKTDINSDKQLDKYTVTASSKGISPFKIIEPDEIDMISAYIKMSNRELTEYYDKARLKNEDSIVLQTLKIIDHSIEKIESFSIGEPTIYITSKNHARLPLFLFGDAIRHISTIVLTLINTKNKILLIDEVENGIHYTSQEEFWKALFKLCIDFDIQIFATTHSLEMIKAFAKAGLMQESTQGAYFEMAIDPRTNKIISIKRDLETLDYAIQHSKGVRGE